MNEQEYNKRLVEDHYAAFWSGNEPLMREQLASDYLDHGSPEVPMGVEATLAYARGLRAAFPDMNVTIRSAVAEGDHVALHGTWRGTHKGPLQGVPATNKAIAFEGMVFWRMANGKIAERWGILDTASMMRQLQA